MHREEGALEKFYNANINLATGLQVFEESFLVVMSEGDEPLPTRARRPRHAFWTRCRRLRGAIVRKTNLRATGGLLGSRELVWCSLSTTC